MTQLTRSRKKYTSGSKPKESKAELDLLSALFYDDVEDTRNSVGLVHPLVWESLFENTHDILKLSSRKTSLATPRKSSKNAGKNHDVKKKVMPDDFLTSEDEEIPRYKAASNKNKSTKNVVFNVRQKITTKDFLTSSDEECQKCGASSNKNKDIKNVLSNVRRKNLKEEFLDDQQGLFSTKSTSKYNSKTDNNESKLRKDKTERQTTREYKDVVAKTTPSSKRNEVLPTNVRRKNLKEEFLDDQQGLFSTKSTSKYNSKTDNNESNLRKDKTERQTTREYKDVVAKTTSSSKRNEVLPTRKLRSSHKDTKPVHGTRSVNDFSIENMDWYYENKDYYIKKYYDILSDHAIPETGRTKSNATNAYTYLLLDSRQCKNRRNISWLDFIYAIFYIGKGTGDRAFQHAKDTEKWLIEKISGTGKKDKKFQKIEEIWASMNPIKVFKVTESITDNEAFTREAAMIDAMGLRRLCNKVSGHYGLGRAVMLKALERCELGATLLIEAWEIFNGKEANVTDVKPKKKEIFDLFFC